MLSFALDDRFIASFSTSQPKWGPVGYVTYKRTYARDLDRVYPRHQELGQRHGLLKSEEFWLTLTRVVEGSFSIQKNHCLALRLPWSETIAQRKAQEMYRLMWDFRFLPPGRGLWMMGAPIVDKLGGGALNNCGFASTKDLATDFAGPFCFLMDFSMLGVGIGFDCKGAGTVSLTSPKRLRAEDENGWHVIADTREGWVAALRVVFDAFAGLCPLPEFDYSLIRPAGAPIMGFGGTASGPAPLQKMLEDITALLEEAVHTGVSSSTIVDAMNMIGRCVVAGNVRRSAEIAFGDPDDEAFLELKDADKNAAALSSHRWASNNSIFAKVGQKYASAAKRTAKNGEPGFAWLENAQRYGRMIDPPNDKDAKALGGNPCQPAWATVLTPIGISTIGKVQIGDEIWSGKQWTKITNKWSTGQKQVRAYRTRAGTFYGTENHRVVQHGEKFEVRYASAIDACPNPPGMETRKYFGAQMIEAEEMVSVEEVFDLTVEDDEHTYWTGGLLVSNCLEQTLHDRELCLSGDTRILTDRGYVEIADLVGEQVKVATSFVSDEDFTSRHDFKQATVFASGTKSTIVLETIDGRRLTCTENHPLLVEGEYGLEWIPAGEVLPGDSLISGNAQLDEHPPALSSTFYALGHFAGDGWLLNTNGRRAVGICAGGHEEGLINRLLPIWEELVKEAVPYIETNYDDRYKASLRVRRDHNGVFTIAITKPQVFRMLQEKYGFVPGTAPTKRLPACYWSASSDEKRSFLRGLFDADGCTQAVKRGWVTLTAANDEFARDVLLALSEFGITARMTTHYLQERGRSQTILGTRGADNLKAFEKHIFFESSTFPSIKADKLKGINAERLRETNGRTSCVVRTVSRGYDQPVFNLEVPGARHYIAEGLVVHNCNLVETFPFNHSSPKEYRRTLKFAYLYAKTVTLVPTHDARTNAVTMANRRIGCSMSGVVQAISKFGYRGFVDLCDVSYAYIQELDREYSDWLCIPRSIKTTSIKPSGTISLLPQATPGMHDAQSEYYWRVIRFATDSGMLPAIRRAGYMCIEIAPEKEPNTTAVYFPVKEEGFERGVADVSMLEQLERAAMLQGHWADNQVSATITFDRATEGPQIARALEIYETRLKGVSFLPREDHGYEHAPYQPISAEEYYAAVAGLRPLDLSDSAAEIVDEFCDGGKCELPLRAE